MTTQFILFNLIFALLVGLFWLLFRQKSYFQFNRFLLLVLIPLAWSIPKVPGLWPAEKTLQERIEFTVTQAESQFINETVVLHQEQTENTLHTWSILDIFTILYGIGLFFFAARFLGQSYQLLHFIRKNPKQTFRDHVLVEPSIETMPFSFFKYLILPSSIQSEALRQQIIAHELVHIHQRHSIDLIVANLLKVICWWNPMVWIFRRLIEQNQEFLVDQTLLKVGVDPKNYQFNLLKVQFQRPCLY